MTQSVITAGDASTGLVQSAGNDGTLVLQVGAAGAKVNALSFDAAGNPTLLKQPVLPAQSMVRLNTANGFGSTNIVIRRFTNVVTNQGSDITYADSAANGATFTINTNGVYAFSYSDSAGSALSMGLSLNSAQLTTSIDSITMSTKLINTTTVTTDDKACGWSGYLQVGDVVRAHTSGVAGGVASRCTFTATRVS
jgi:VCBS repeat-containing protein